jgi:hypothetical protein
MALSFIRDISVRHLVGIHGLQHNLSLRGWYNLVIQTLEEDDWT